MVAVIGQGHGVGGGGHGGGDAHQHHAQRVPPKAQEDGGDQGAQWGQHQPDGGAADDGRQVVPHPAQLQRSAQGHQGGHAACIAHAGHGLDHGAGQGDVQPQAQPAQSAADDQGVAQDAFQNADRVGPPAPAALQGDDGQGVIGGHHQPHRHGHEGHAVAAHHGLGQGHAHHGDVGAVAALNIGPPAAQVGLQLIAHGGTQQEPHHHPGQQIDENAGVARAGQVGAVQVGEHQAGQKGVEADLAQVVKGLLRDDLTGPEQNAHAQRQKHGRDAVEGDEKVYKHNRTPYNLNRSL